MIPANKRGDISKADYKSHGPVPYCKYFNSSEKDDAVGGNYECSKMGHPAHCNFLRGLVIKIYFIEDIDIAFADAILTKGKCDGMD